MDDRLYDENRRSVHKVYLNARQDCRFPGIQVNLMYTPPVFIIKSEIGRAHV